MPSGSKPISGFPDGSPPQNTDDYVFERGQVTYRIPYLTLQNAIIAAIGPIRTTPIPPMLSEAVDGEIGEDGFPIVGPRGAIGPVGPGTFNNFNTVIFGPVDGIDGEDAEAIPGVKGLPGTNGAPGATGINGLNAPFMLPDAPDEPDEPLIIKGPTGAQGIQGIPGVGGGGGSIVMMLPESSDELDEPFIPYPRPFPDPDINKYAPGPFSVPTGNYVIMANRLQLSLDQTVYGYGDSTLRIT